MIQQPRRPRHRTTASSPSSSSFPTTPWPPRLHHQLLLPSPLPALLQLQLLLFFLCLCCWAEPSRGHLFSSVCQFPPIDDWLTCQRDQGGAGSSSAGGSAEPAAEQPPPLLNGWFCDPEYSMSMSEVTALDESVRRLYAQHGRSQCVCPASRHPPPVPMPAGEEGEEAAAAAASAEPEEAEAGFDEEHGHCWHRFAFAFVHQLRVGPDVLRVDQCLPRPANESGSEEAAPNSLEAQRRFELPPDWENRPDESFALFGQNFARVLRERWALGRCGEDLLILVVQQPPVQQMSAGPMSSASSRLFGALPMLFIAPGPLVQQQLGSLQLEQFVHEANSQLQREARPLHRVLGHLLVRLGVALARAHQQPAGGGGTHMRPKLRSHVPLWAWAVFGACGVAFGLMALGLFLIRTGTRRSNASNGQQQGSQSGMVARRHWKEGDEPPPPQTYVNLVQMLMPHPKPAPTNMPQQV